MTRTIAPDAHHQHFHGFLTPVKVKVRSKMNSILTLKRELGIGHCFTMWITSSCLRYWSYFGIIAASVTCRDSRAILKVDRKIPSTECRPGKLVYFGVSEFLNRVLSIRNITCDTILLDIRIDELPIFNSASTQFWPILCRVQEIKKVVGCIALYYGDGKPENVNEYLW